LFFTAILKRFSAVILKLCSGVVRQPTTHLVTDLETKKGDRIGDRQIKAITPLSADKIYEIVLEGPSGARPGQAEKVVGLCARARVVHRPHPEYFDRDVPNPWRGVAKNRRTKATKPHVTREQVYVFAQTAIHRGYRVIAAAAVMRVAFSGSGERTLHGSLRIAFVCSALVRRQSAALSVREFGFLKSGHAAMPAGIERERRWQLGQLAQALHQMLHAAHRINLGRLRFAVLDRTPHLVKHHQDAPSRDLGEYRLGAGMERVPSLSSSGCKTTAFVLWWKMRIAVGASLPR
jgi:hypothetical protein